FAPSGRIDVYVPPESGANSRDLPVTATNAGGLSFARAAAASGWYCPAYTWYGPVGSWRRARHIGASYVATFSTSVSTPTTKSRLIFAPSGVTRYEGLRSPPSDTSLFASLNSPANTRHAISRFIRLPPCGPRSATPPPPASGLPAGPGGPGGALRRAPPAPRASPAPPPGRPP